MIMIKLMEEDGVSDPISASGTNDLINMMPLHRVVCSFKREEIHLKYRVHVPPNVHIRSRFSPSKISVFYVQLAKPWILLCLLLPSRKFPHAKVRTLFS